MTDYNRYKITDYNREAVDYCRELLRADNSLTNRLLRDKVKEKTGMNLHNVFFGIIRRELGLSTLDERKTKNKTDTPRKTTRRQRKLPSQHEELINNVINELEPEVIHSSAIAVPPDLHQAISLVSRLLKRYNYESVKIKNNGKGLLFSNPKPFDL